MMDLKDRSHTAFRVPTNKEIKLWRYMGLAKYLSILQRKAIFFPRASLLGDPFEGSSTKPMVAAREEFSKYISNKSTMGEKFPDNLSQTVSDSNKEMVSEYLINCWHMNEHESAAMWSQYAHTNEAVCIQSTYRRLDLYLPTCVFIGEVTYIDYNIESIHEGMVFNFIMHKRKSFEHERELRAVFWMIYGIPEAAPYKKDAEPAGLAIKVDVNVLIERVYISPLATPWFATIVKNSHLRLWL